MCHDDIVQSFGLSTSFVHFILALVIIQKFTLLFRCVRSHRIPKNKLTGDSLASVEVIITRLKLEIRK